MSSEITITTEQIGKNLFDLASLVGLLHHDTGATTATLNDTWFEDPSVEIEDILTRTAEVAAVLDNFLGPAEEGGPTVFTDSAWYPIPNPSTGQNLGVYIITPNSSTTTDSEIGMGVFHPMTVGAVTITIYGYIPLFSLGSNVAQILTTKPIQIGLTATTTADGGFAPTGTETLTSFAKMAVTANYTLDNASAAPTAQLAFYANADDPPDSPIEGQTYDSFSAVIANEEVEAAILEIIIQAGYVLYKYIGSSTATIGDVLYNAGLLDYDSSAKQFHFNLNKLKALVGDPLGAAVRLTFALLDALADATNPVIPLPNGGLWVASEDGHYGARLMIDSYLLNNRNTTTATGANTSPDVSLRLGGWLSGESDSQNWVQETSGTIKKPGISLFILKYTGEPGSIDTGAVTFTPGFELTSVGLDIAGTEKQPLVNLKGQTIRGFEARGYLEKVDEAWKFGIAARLDHIGLSLAPTNGTNSSNPVASNMLSSGSSGSAANQTTATAPTYSIKTAYLKDGEPPFCFYLYDTNDKTTDEIWIPVKRSFGPLECTQLGVGWRESEKDLVIGFKGSVALAGLALDVINLSIGIPITNPTEVDKYDLDLDGLSLLYQNSSVRISAGFMKSGSGQMVEYNGEALLQISKYGIAAVGSYGTTTEGDTSLFIFAVLTTPLGGPPAFFVTGLAAGFGYNRKLVAPAFDQVSKFPLVAAATDPSAVGVSGDTVDINQLATILSTFDTAVPPSLGNYWLAAGVKFISFDLIDSLVLLAVQFGKDFEILILGTSSITLPPNASTAENFAFAELEIEVVIQPEEGFVGATAVLAPSSYIITKDCHLTGGFAFYAWFGDNVHSGDFVLTLGGYHPAFKKPDWYPTVPRLGFNWPISSNLSMSGGVYFALTPECIMGGGQLNANFKMGSWLTAWFNAYANFLMFWKPFSYDISMGVSIGVKASIKVLFCTITVQVEVSADLDVWGPSTGGIANVHLYFVSFTIRFGPSRTNLNPTVDWSNFKQMLPQNSTSQTPPAGEQEAVLLDAAGQTLQAPSLQAEEDQQQPNPQIVINDGLISQSNVDGETIWLVRGADFMFSTQNSVPSSSVQPGANDEVDSIDFGGTVSIRPMGITSYTAEFEVTITTVPTTGIDDPDLSFAHWIYEADYQDVPAAMWDAPLPSGAKPAAAANMVNRLLGLKNITPRSRILRGTPAVDITRALTDIPVMDDFSDYPTLPLAQAPVAVGPSPMMDPDAFSEIEQIYNTSEDPTAAQTKHGDLLSALAGFGLYQTTDPDQLSQMATRPRAVFKDAPMVH